LAVYDVHFHILAAQLESKSRSPFQAGTHRVDPVACIAFGTEAPIIVCRGATANSGSAPALGFR